MEGEEQLNNDLSANEEGVGENYGFIDINSKSSVDKRSAKEKATVAIVLVTAFLAVIFGFSQLSQAMKNPFVKLFENAPAVPDEESAQALAILEQKQKDTDGDLLSDYDELNAYGTSPYLADSDSDGISDKEEIDTGHDPNCSGSDTCFKSDTAISNQNISTDGAQALFSGQSDPTIIRNLLIQKGFPKETLDQISDEQLMATYQQALAGENPTTSSGSDTQTANIDLSKINIKSLDDLKNLTGAQIRQLMISQGAPADVLSQVSDEQLKNMFLSKLNEQSN